MLPSLEVGGAETVATRLIGASDRTSFAHAVLALLPVGEFERDLRAMNVEVAAVRPDAGGFAMVRDTQRQLRALRPDVVHCWMYHANLVGGLASLASGRPPLVWSIRQTNLDLASIRLRTRRIARAGAWLSRVLPDRILYNAETSRRVHEAFGYRRAATDQVIPNGFDTGSFAPDPVARAAVRAELGIDPGAMVVGLVARFDPQKDHRTFVAAAGAIHAARPDIWFVLCGRGIDAGNATLLEWIEGAGIAGRTRLLGQRPDIARLNAAFDIACLSSMGEGFPNSVGEAMACGIPCAVTEVGAAAELVGDTGRAVPAMNPPALADAVLQLASLDPEARAALGAHARARVVEHFGLQAMVDSYQKLWRELAAGRRRAAITGRGT